MKSNSQAVRAAFVAVVAALLMPAGGPGAEHRHRQRQGRAEGARRQPAAAGRARRARRSAPEMEAQARTRWCCARSSRRRPRRRASPPRPTTRAQMELARQSILIRELFEDFKKKNPVTDAEPRPSTTSSRPRSAGTEYRARHILVENEDEAKALIAQIKGGAKFEDLAKKNSKDPGSGAERRRPRLRQGRFLRARVRPGDGQAEEGRDDRRRR